ncbi:MAG: FUSC family protein [Acidimicrobiales bacterium]
MTAPRLALRDAIRLDSTLITPVVGAITALPVVALFVVGLLVSSPREAISLAIGANLVAVVSLIGAPRLALSWAFADAIAMAVGVFAGVVTEPYSWLHVALLVPWCFGAGLLSSLGTTQGAIGTQAVIAYVVLGRFGGSPLTALNLSLVVLLGALVEIAALVVLRLPPSLRVQRFRLAAAFSAVATLARESPTTSAVPALAVVDEAERVLDAPSLFGRTDTRTVRAALDQLRRCRLELTTLAGLRVRLGDVDDAAALRVERCAHEVAEALEELAVTLRRPTAAQWRRAVEAVAVDVNALEHAATGDLATQCARRLRAMVGQLRATGALLDSLGSTPHAWRLELPRLTRVGDDEGADLTMLREGLDTSSPAFRHGVRLAVAVPASALLATWLSLPRGYWLPFAVAAILRPDYSSLVRRGVSRVLGTALGASLAAVLVSVLHPDEGLAALMVAALAWAAYSTWSANFALSIGLVTSLVLVLLSVSQVNPISTALDRLVDVAIGGALAVVTYLLWPTPAGAGVHDAIDDLYARLADYLDVVTTSEPVRSAVDVAERSRAARVAFGHAEEAVGRGMEEPSATRVDAESGRGLLAAAMRVLRATHALRGDVEHGVELSATPELATLTNAIAARLRSLETAAASGVDLRALQSVARDATALPDDVSGHLDELVNATNTAAHLRAAALD